MPNRIIITASRIQAMQMGEWRNQRGCSAGWRDHIDGYGKMGKIPALLRETIARNIRDCRLKKFPGRGGGKKCAEAFSAFIGKNVSPQQWSPWERGMRSPDELRMEQIANFFEVTVEYLRRDNTPPVPGAPSAGVSSPITPEEQLSEGRKYDRLSAPELIMAMLHDRMKAVYQLELSVSSVSFVSCEAEKEA